MTVGGTTVTSCLGVCGFVRWQFRLLDKKIDEIYNTVDKKLNETDNQLRGLALQQAELTGQLKLLIGKGDAC